MPNYTEAKRQLFEAETAIKQGGRSEIYKKYAPQFQNLSNANAQSQ